MWFLWKARNSAKFENNLMNSDHVLLGIKRYVSNLYTYAQLKLSSDDVPAECMSFLSFLLTLSKRDFGLSLGDHLNQPGTSLIAMERVGATQVWLVEVG